MSGPSPLQHRQEQQESYGTSGAAHVLLPGRGKALLLPRPCSQPLDNPWPEQGTIHTYLCITEAHQDKALLEFSSSNPFCYKD